MEMFLLMLLILMFAVAITNAKEIYLYMSLLLGSLIKDIQSKVVKNKKK